LGSESEAVPICPFDGRPCDGKWVFGSPSCFQSVFAVNSKERVHSKDVGVCPRLRVR
jgi:hypothetical protein